MFFQDGAGDPWRAFCDRLHGQLIEECLGTAAVERALKTDLFDEAAGIGLVAGLSTFSREVHAIDLSPRVVAEAATANPTGRFVAADVRHLPYPDGFFDIIVSNSTLDHFPHAEDIAEAVAELHRVLKPSGRLLITFDNLANPVIALRHWLPFEMLNRWGLVPYFVGESVTPEGLRRLLNQSGFTVGTTKTMMHVPRVAAVWISRRFKGSSPGTVRRLLGIWAAFEALSRLPTRNLTGYYTVALAVKPAAWPTASMAPAVPADAATE